MSRYIIFLLFFISSSAFCQGVLTGQEVYISLPEGELTGTLTTPLEARTLVILHSGSGPTDRDGNQPNMKNNSLKMLSDEMTRAELATFRFDKRGVAKSKVTDFKEEDLSIDTYVNDLKLWIDKMKNTGNFDQIWIAGHSEGVLIGTLAALDNPHVSGFIALAGTGRPADILIKEQLQNQPQFVMDAAMPIVVSLKAGNQVEEVPQFLNMLFRKSVQPYLISWFKYDPAEEMSKLKIPILVVHGLNDLQVSEQDANVLAEASSKAKLLLIEDMNHVLKQTEENSLQGQMKTYADPEILIHDELVSKIISFIKSNP